LAEESHFTRAAARVHVTQSSLSSSIRALERELGGELFVRSTRRVALTEAGRALLPAARRAVEAAEVGRDAVAGVRGLVRGQLAIGVIQSQTVGAVSVAELVARYRRRHPAVTLRLHHAGVASLVHQTADGELELAIVDLPLGPQSNRVSARRLGTESLLLLPDGRPQFTIGAAGGSTIPETIVQTLIEHVDFGMPLSAALAAPRVSQTGSPTLEAEPAFYHSALRRQLSRRFGEKFSLATGAGAAAGSLSRRRDRDAVPHPPARAGDRRAGAPRRRQRARRASFALSGSPFRHGVAGITNPRLDAVELSTWRQVPSPGAANCPCARRGFEGELA
jgi:DNA-binding transcriptional LysR family regulator